VAHFIFSNHTMPTQKKPKEPPSQGTKTAVNNGQITNQNEKNINNIGFGDRYLLDFLQ